MVSGCLQQKRLVYANQVSLVTNWCVLLHLRYFSRIPSLLVNLYSIFSPVTLALDLKFRYFEMSKKSSLCSTECPIVICPFYSFPPRLLFGFLHKGFCLSVIFSLVSLLLEYTCNKVKNKNKKEKGR